MNRKDILNKIAEGLSRFRSEVEILSSENLYDTNLHAENVLIPLLNETYDLNLVNANTIRKNYPGIDLVDRENRIAFQITSSSTITKVKETLKTFIDHKLEKEIDIIFVFILGKKQANYSKDGVNSIIGKKIDFSVNEHIIDGSDLFSLLNMSLKLDKLQRVSELLQAEFSDTKIQLRKSLAEKKEEFIKEKIFPNILNISLPETIYIGDMRIDRDDVIKKSWETDHKLKMTANDRKVLMKAIEFSELKIGGDWHVFENKLISFRDFHDSGLDRFVETGTVEEISTEEFPELGVKYYGSLVQLINNSVTQKLYQKSIKWINKHKIYRFAPLNKMPNVRKISWKNINRATRTVIDEIWNSDKTQITAFKHLAFKTQVHFFNNNWCFSITPTWSYTWNGYSKSNSEPKLLSGIKRLENNKSIYLTFKFIAYCLINKLDEEKNVYDTVKFSDPIYDTLIFKP